MRDVLDKIAKMVRRSMIYASDEVVFNKPEYWRSWKDDVLNGVVNIRDDCDGFAMTISELAIHFGFKPEDVAICYCVIQPRGEGHLATKIRLPDTKEWYILDCNYQTPILRGMVRDYDWKSCMYFDKPGVWVNETK